MQHPERYTPRQLDARATRLWNYLRQNEPGAIATLMDIQEAEIDWPAILQLIQEYGPIIAEIILAILNDAGTDDEADGN
jgi:hypothetical protein